MKDTKKIIEELIDVQIGYYNDRKEITKYLEDQPVVLAMLESYTKRIENITKVIVEDILEIPQQPSNNKYEQDNLHQRTVAELIEYTALNNGKHKSSAIELIMDWKNIFDKASKVSSETWFYQGELLEEYSKGFPAYQQKLEEEEKEKKKRTKKETA
ncbi:hypothetical protein [Priestia megaterium]|uniref:hypothetical protein n=1 Tax=Priestia megaterium TaxID=1404 RepID=UPI000BFA66C7|nr:hypothetical protein [Priestia megaterium]PFR90764.1 hypothetical protein COK39_24300 [Priestia megaterium]